MSIPSVNITVAGFYSCIVFNDAGFGVDISTLYMTPLIIKHPQSSIAKSEDSLNLTCMAQSFPSPTYQWQKFNETTSQFVNIFSNGNNSILELNPIGLNGYGLYHCVVSTFVKEITNSTISNVARISLGIVIYNVSMFICVFLIAPPTINVLNNIAESGDIVMFNCSTNGEPSVFKWYKGDTEIITGGPFTIINITEDLSILKIHIVSGIEHDNYTCVVTNIAGETQATTRLSG